uniref:Retrovirus-related Pol polyprotein from transposon TNT 1-94 n=1 Tax=Ceratitis capitata TaxID=7213 RepID=W8AQ86_CERCA
MANALANIEKLSGDNYTTWCIQIKSLLITLDLWNAVLGKSPETEPEKSAWTTYDQKALAAITLSVKPSELIHIKNCLSAKCAWETLSALYKADTASRKVNLFKRLIRFKFRGNEKFSDQLKEFCCVIEDLKEVGITMDNDFLSILLLCSLPDEMESFIVAMESRDTLPKLDNLIAKILEEEQRHGEKLENGEGVFSANEAKFRVRAGGSRSSDSSRGVWRNREAGKSNSVGGGSSGIGAKSKHQETGRYNNIKCYKCGMRGHIRSQCTNSATNDKAWSLFEKKENIRRSWIIDSGATSHMCNDMDSFTSLIRKRHEIMLASGAVIYAHGRGTVKIRTKNSNINLRDVWYVPELHSNFFSISKSVECGNAVIFKENSVVIRNCSNKVIMTGNLENGIYVANTLSNKIKESVNAVSDANDWHRRFGHINVSDLNKLHDLNMVNGLKANLPKTIECFTCAVCKIHSKPYMSYSNIYTKNVLELVHTDLCGPMGIGSVGGASYFVTFIDDYSRYTAVYFIKRKSEALNMFKLFTASAEKQTGRKIKSVRSDNGREFVNSEFEKYLSERGIRHQTTVAYSPQQNGVAERANRTIVEMARCMINESKLPQTMWAEAVSTAVYIRNRCPTNVLGQATPYEKWHGRKPSVSHFRTFGCDAVVLQKGPRPRGCKFLPKGIKLKFVGYHDVTKGYRLVNLQTNKITIARDVIFFEKSFETNLKIDNNREEPFYMENEINKSEESTGNENNEECDENNNEEDEGESGNSSEYEEVVDNKRKRGRPRFVRSGGVGRPKKVYCVENGLEMLNSIIENPNSVSEALSSSEAKHWKKAMNAEYESLMRNGTWELVDRPKNGNVIGCKWVFSIKRNPDGSTEKYKARLVALGCSQKYNVDYCETFAPVVRHSTIRLILALAAKNKLLVNHVDIVAAYLNGELEETVYMLQPPMFKENENSNKVCRLKKALYGLKQAGREWNRKVTDILLRIGFKRCKSDTSVYIRRNGKNVNIIGLYVDDMILACSSKSEMSGILRKLNEYVEAVDRGPISFYLGMEIERDGDRGDITIHQKRYVEEILQQWGMDDCKPAATPWAPGTVLQKCDRQCDNLETKAYQSLLGGLMYLAVISRPDIAHVVSKLSQFNSHPHKEHLNAAKYVLRYLKKNPVGKLTFSAKCWNFICFTDADWGSNNIDRKSFTGYVILMAGGAIAWESRKQSVVALSSMEAEYVALCQGTKEVVFLRVLLSELGYGEYVKGPTSILCDNQSALYMVKNPLVQKRSKHIDIRYHYIREMHAEQQIEVEYIPTDDNAADVLTKVLGKQKHIIAHNLLRMKF